MNEEWRDIPGFEGYYQASNKGHIRSVDRYAVTKRGHHCFYPSKIRHPATDKDGYKRVWLRTNGKPTNIGVHQLVAMSFLDFKRGGNQTINHLNGDKSDNSINNLEIVSIQANIQHAIKNKLWNCRGERNVNAKFSQNEVDKIRQYYYSTKISCKKLAQTYNVGRSTIFRIVKFQSYKNVY